MRIIYWLLATTALIVSTFAQTPNGTRKAWNDTLWIDRDGTYQLVGDYINTQNQSTLQFKDTTQLKAASFDSAGFVVNLKQLSSANTRGGGQFVLRPAAEYAVDGGICFASGNASYEWVRNDWLKNKEVNVLWFGAVGDNATDNSASIAKARAVAAANRGGGLFFPEGQYKTSAPINATSPNEGQNRRSFYVRGEGIGKTEIVFTDTSQNGIDVNFGGGTSYSYNVHIHDLSIVGSGTSGARGSGKGINFEYTELGTIERVLVTGFKYGIYFSLVNSPVVENSRIFGNKYGVWGETAANEYAIRNCYVVSNDSIGWYQGAGIVPGWYGGAMGSQPIHLYLANGANASVFGGNWESYTANAAFINSNAELRIYSLSINGGSTGKVFYAASGIGGLYIYDIDITNITPTQGHVFAAGTAPTVLNFGRSAIRIYRSTIGDYHNAQSFAVGKPDNASFTADSAGAGKLDWFRARKVSTLQDRLYWYANMGASRGYEEVELSRGWDWGINTSDVVGTQRSRPERVAFTVGHKDTTTLAGDSTVCYVQVDTNATGELYFAGGFTDRTTGTAADHYGGTYVEVQNYSTSTGKLKFVIWHPNATAGNLAIKLYWFAIYQRSVF